MSEFFRSCRDTEIVLAPCPICGSASELWERKNRHEDMAVKVVICTNREPLGTIEEGCPLLMPPEGFYRSAPQEAADVWNGFAETAGGSLKGPIAKLLQMQKAIKKYYLAIDRREHGGLAVDYAFNEIQQALGMYWQPGEALKEFEQNPGLFK